ncbi:MAG TPA: hypothetical protein VFF98_05260 [Novosphingobium sp.]|nr:hypothetical protein [Novosphingobium sp.]HZV11362.1 hypothetical protein [Novosphingobium sp.]
MIRHRGAISRRHIRLRQKNIRHTGLAFTGTSVCFGADLIGKQGIVAHFAMEMPFNAFACNCRSHMLRCNKITGARGNHS